jgi:hypothetical protein
MELLSRKFLGSHIMEDFINSLHNPPSLHQEFSRQRDTLYPAT